MVVEHGLGPVAVDRLDLGEVLPDGDEADVVAAGRRGVAGQVSKGCDVARFVEHHQARVVELAALGRGGVVGSSDGLLDQHVEHRPKSSLLVGGSDDVDGVVAAQPFDEVDVVVVGGLGHLRVGVPGEP